MRKIIDEIKKAWEMSHSYAENAVLVVHPRIRRALWELLSRQGLKELTVLSYNEIMDAKYVVVGSVGA